MPLPAGYKIDDKGKPPSISQLKEQAAKLKPIGVDKPTENLLRHIRAPHLRTTEESEHAHQLTPAGNAPPANVQPTASYGEVRSGILNATEPQTQDDAGTLTMKRAARGLFGIVDFVPQTAGIVKNLFSSDPQTSVQAENDLLSLHPGAQISDRGREAIEEYKKSPKLAAANVAGDALTIFLTDKLTPIHENETTLYHGSPGEIPSLQAGSMLTPDKAWAAGYTTKTDIATGKESFSGNVYSTNLPKGNILTVNGSLHDLEQHLVNMGKQAGVTGGGLKGIAEGVAKHTGYDAIVGKSPDGKITGAIVLKEHPHTGKLDPRTAVQETKSKGLPIASNLEKLILPETIEESMPESAKAPDRRVDVERRKRVSEMSIEDLRKELLTSDKTGIPNRRAFDDAQHGQPTPAVAMSDADGLKALNDRFGYEAGDALLKAKAEALKEAGLDSYHDKGDEFLHRGDSPESLKEKLDKAREILRNRVIEVKMKDGTTRRFKGADFSYGTGKDLAESEAGLKEHKNTREAAGERARGELRGITEVAPEAKDTPEFKSWFGASKVLDPQGQPLTVHHQTWNEIVGDFDRQWAAKKFNRDMEGTDTVGVWFSDHPDLGKYGPRNVDAYLKISNPKIYEDIGTDRKDSAFMQLRDDIQDFGGATKFREYLKKKGYDGIFLKNAKIDIDPANTWVALDSDQIKIQRQTITHPEKIRQNEELRAKNEAMAKEREAAKTTQTTSAQKPQSTMAPQIATDANGNPVLSPEEIGKWSQYMRGYPFKTEPEAREWLYNRLQHEDKSNWAEMFGKNGPEKNRQIADSMPLYKHGRTIKIGRKEKPGPVSKDRLGTDRPEGDVPNVDWHKQDLQDSGRPITKQSILRDYNNGKAAEVYKSYVDVSDLPEEQLAEEMDVPEGGAAETSYDWDELGASGRYRAVPPIKIRVKKNGKIDILDGNHRTRFWKERGFTSVPAWVIDQRSGIKGLEEE